MFMSPIHAIVERDGLSMISWKIHLTPKTEQLDIEFIVQNNSDIDVTLEFPTSQFYDYSIFDVNNKEVYRFSKGRYFLQAFQYIKIPKGTEKIWKGSWDYTSQGQKLKEGHYVLKAVLRPSKINGERPVKSFIASEEFSIPIIQDLNIQKTKSDMRITGKLLHTIDGYYYTVDNGHNESIEKTPLQISNGNISVTIPLFDGTQIFTIFNKEGNPIYVMKLG